MGVVWIAEEKRSKLGLLIDASANNFSNRFLISLVFSMKNKSIKFCNLNVWCFFLSYIMHISIY